MKAGARGIAKVGEQGVCGWAGVWGKVKHKEGQLWEGGRLQAWGMVVQGMWDKRKAKAQVCKGLGRAARG